MVRQVGSTNSTLSRGSADPLFDGQREQKLAEVHHQQWEFKWQQWASPSGVGRPHHGALDPSFNIHSTSTCLLSGLPLLLPLWSSIFITSVSCLLY